MIRLSGRRWPLPPKPPPPLAAAAAAAAITIITTTTSITFTITFTVTITITITIAITGVVGVTDCVRAGDPAVRGPVDVAGGPLRDADPGHRRHKVRENACGGADRDRG